MEAEQVVHCLRTLKTTPEEAISENTCLPRSKKAETNTSKGLGACSSTGTVKSRNCCKGYRAASQISQVIKQKPPWFWRKLQSFLQRIKLLRIQTSGLKARILFEQGFSLNKEKLAGNYLFISCLYILPYLAASRFSIKTKKKK